MESMSTRDDLLRELDGAPEPVVLEVLAYLRRRKSRGGETALLSEAVLARDWLRPEEDEAWADL